MPWELSITIIDVGQGESSFIQTWNKETCQYTNMLIDGGLAGQAEVVNETIDNCIQRVGMDDPHTTPVNTIVVSHYDKDHSSGIIQLLILDNIYMICDCLEHHIGLILDRYVPILQKDLTASQFIGAVSAGLFSIFNGVYCNDHLLYRIADKIAGRMGKDQMDDNAAICFGIRNAKALLDIESTRLSPMLLPTGSIKSAMTHIIGLIIIEFITSRPPNAPSILEHIINYMMTLYCNQNYCNSPRIIGRFKSSIIYDTGDISHMPSFYIQACEGKIQFASFCIQAPGITRVRRSAYSMLGRDIMWPTELAANTPMIFVFASNAQVLGSTNEVSKYKHIVTGDASNILSIGLILRFNNFNYYTGGDLPEEGEMLIVRAWKTRCAYSRIAAFKCGHHGAGTSTSVKFVREINPVTAFISSGANSYGHPTTITLTTLQECTSIKKYYLTGAQCIEPPLTDNLQYHNPSMKSRMAGVSCPPANNIEKGHITLNIIEDQTNGTLDTNSFSVIYFEEEMRSLVTEIFCF